MKTAWYMENIRNTPIISSYPRYLILHILCCCFLNSSEFIFSIFKDDTCTITNTFCDTCNIINFYVKPLLYIIITFLKMSSDIYKPITTNIVGRGWIQGNWNTPFNAKPLNTQLITKHLNLRSSVTVDHVTDAHILNFLS